MSQEHSTPKVVNLHSMTHEGLAFEAEKYDRIRALGTAIIALVHDSEADETKRKDLGVHIERLTEMILSDLDKLNDTTEELAALSWKSDQEVRTGL